MPKNFMTNIWSMYLIRKCKLAHICLVLVEERKTCSITLETLEGEHVQNDLKLYVKERFKVLTPSCQPTMPKTTSFINFVCPKSLIIGGSSTTCKPWSKTSATSLAIVQDTFALLVGAISCKILHELSSTTSSSYTILQLFQLSTSIAWTSYCRHMLCGLIVPTLTLSSATLLKPESTIMPAIIKTLNPSESCEFYILQEVAEWDVSA